MSKFTHYLLVIIILGIGLVLEYLRQSAGLPATILDILLFPIITVFNLILLKLLFIPGKADAVKPSQSALMNIVNFVIFIMMLVLGLWCITEGVQAPLAYFSGAKGSFHGYTLITLGVCIILFGVLGVKMSIRIAWHFLTNHNI